METIDRVKMVDVTIGVTDLGTPFVSDADEIHVLYYGWWFSAEWATVPEDIEGDIEEAANWLWHRHYARETKG